MILGTIISVFLFDFHLTAQFAWGAALVISSAYMYGVYSLALLAPPRPPRSPRTHPQRLVISTGHDSDTLGSDSLRA